MKNNKSLYLQLIDKLVEEIKLMSPGEKLLSERQLCIDLNVSRTTVRNAINFLENKGYVKRIQGKGTFVNDSTNKRENLSDYYSFTEQTKRLGKTPKSIILEYKIKTPNKAIAKILGITSKMYVIEFLRLRLADNEPMLLERTYIKYEEFKNITRALLEETPLYDIYRYKYDINISKIREKYSVAKLNERDAEFLNLNKNDPSLEIKRFSFDQNNNIIEYTVSYASGDKFEYETIYFPN